MNTLVVLLLLTLLSPVAPASMQQKSTPPGSIPIASPNRTVGQAEIYYFSEVDKTSVDVLNLVIWGSGPERITLNMSYSNPGRKPLLPAEIELDIESISRKKRFEAKSSVEFTINGKKWPGLDVSPQIEEEPSSFLESCIFKLTIEQFREIAHANSVIVKLGDLNVALKQKHIAAFKDMLRAAE